MCLAGQYLENAASGVEMNSLAEWLVVTSATDGELG